MKSLKKILKSLEIVYNESEIKNVAQTNNLNIDDFQIIDCADKADAITTAVALVRDDKANILMKGLTHTADILRAVLNRETGIRGDGILSHVSVLYSPSHDRQLFLTDMAMVMYPDLNTKVKSAQKFLADGNRVKVSVRFRGREMAHTNLGEKLLMDFAAACAEVATMEKNPKLEGRFMAMFLTPKNSK